MVSSNQILILCKNHKCSSVLSCLSSHNFEKLSKDIMNICSQDFYVRIIFLVLWEYIKEDDLSVSWSWNCWYCEEMGTLFSNDAIIFILFPPAMNEFLYPTSLRPFVISALNLDHSKWMYILVADVALIGMTLITHKVSISLNICQCHILFSETFVKNIFV